MGRVSGGKEGKPEESMWDDPEESLEMITSSAIELVEESKKKPIVEDPAEAFFQVKEEPRSVSSSSLSSMSGALVLRRSSPLPWLLLILVLAAAGAAWVQLIEPKFTALDTAESKLATAERELGTSRSEVDRLRNQVAGLETEKAALTTERDTLAAEHAAGEEKLKAREELAERLKIAFANEKRVEIAVLDDAVALRLTTDDVFVFGDVGLKDTALIDQIGGVIKGQGQHRITIAAHTDSTPVPVKLKPRYPSNYELSAARAFAVLRQLEPLQLSEQIEVIAAAATEPIASNKTPQGRRKNRRVELLIR